MRAREAADTERRRAERGLVPSGDEPIDAEDYLVEVWRLYSVGRDDDARGLLAGVWSWAMDNAAHEGVARVALRLLETRIGFLTDDAEAWAALPAELVIYRAETNLDHPGWGVCWTLSQSVAEMHAERHGLTVSRGTVGKPNVLAYITGYGEEEIVVRREHVRAET